MRFANTYGFTATPVMASVAHLHLQVMHLNLHQGNSNNIPANGQPTRSFRPPLCTGL